MAYTFFKDERVMEFLCELIFNTSSKIRFSSPITDCNYICEKINPVEKIAEFLIPRSNWINIKHTKKTRRPGHVQRRV